MRIILLYIVIGISLLQTVGFALNNKQIKGLGLASVASPLPIVFTQFRGVETFSLDYQIRVKDVKGIEKIIDLDSNNYSNLKAPYNLRNVYGAALSYGPAFKGEEIDIRNSILEYSFCKDSSLKKALSIKEVDEVNIHIKSRIKPQKWQFKVECNNERI